MRFVTCGFDLFAGQGCGVCEAVHRVHHRQLGAEGAGGAHAQACPALPTRLSCQVSFLPLRSTLLDHAILPPRLTL